MRFSMLYSGEQILSFKSCLVFHAGDSLRNTCRLIKEFNFISHMFNPILIIAMPSGGGTSQRNLDRIYQLQKRACKIILDYQYENIATSMQELKILNIYERIFLKKAKFMFKIS